jgi:SprT protein
MKTKIENRVLDLLVMTSELAPSGEFEIPKIRFDLKGRPAGACCMMGNKCILRFNLKLLEENQENFLQFTVPHEVAHYITAILYGKVKPHGEQWQNVMHFFGIEHPRRCHSFNIEDTYPWIYKCQCQEHFVSQRQHSSVIKGKRTYICKDCGKVIEFVRKNT